MKFRWKFVFTAAVLVLWAGAAVIAVELFARHYPDAASRGNPFLEAYAEGRPGTPLRPPPDLGDLRLGQSGGFLPWARSGDAAVPILPRREAMPPSVRAAFSVLPSAVEDPGRHVRRREQFPAMDATQRAAFAALHQELALVFDLQGRCVAKYGMALTWPSPAGAILDYIADIEKALAVVPREAWRTQALPPIALRDARRESGWITSDGKDYLFLPVIPAQVYGSLNAAPPRGSHWEIPWLRFLPNFEDLEGTVAGQFSTNRFGYRGPCIEVPKPESHYRILCMGASTTEEGGTDAATYPAMLESLLRARFEERQIEVVNGGVSGITTAGHLWRLKEHLTLDPDLVIVYMGFNDLLLTCLPHAAVNMHGLPRRLLALSEAVRRWGYVAELPSEDQVAEMIDQTLVTNLRALGWALAAEGVALVICAPAYAGGEITAEEAALYDHALRKEWLNPHLSFERFRAYMARINQQLEALAAEEGFHFIPVSRYLSGGPEIFGDICHMMDPGIELKSEVIFRYLAGG